MTSGEALGKEIGAVRTGFRHSKLGNPQFLSTCVPSASLHSLSAPRTAEMNRLLDCLLEVKSERECVVVNSRGLREDCMSFIEMRGCAGSEHLSRTSQDTSPNGFGTTSASERPQTLGEVSRACVQTVGVGLIESGGGVFVAGPVEIGRGGTLGTRFLPSVPQ